MEPLHLRFPRNLPGLDAVARDIGFGLPDAPHKEEEGLTLPQWEGIDKYFPSRLLLPTNWRDDEEEVIVATEASRGDTESKVVAATDPDAHQLAPLLPLPDLPDLNDEPVVDTSSEQVPMSDAFVPDVPIDEGCLDPVAPIAPVSVVRIPPP